MEYKKCMLQKVFIKRLIVVSLFVNKGDNTTKDNSIGKNINNGIDIKLSI
jgi:hypothetical protein